MYPVDVLPLSLIPSYLQAGTMQYNPLTLFSIYSLLHRVRRVGLPAPSKLTWSHWKDCSFFSPDGSQVYTTDTWFSLKKTGVCIWVRSVREITSVLRDWRCCQPQYARGTPVAKCLCRALGMRCSHRLLSRLLIETDETLLLYGYADC
jgi:hypothetical protein